MRQRLAIGLVASLAAVFVAALATAQSPGIGIKKDSTLTGTGSSGSPLGVDTSTIQARVSGTCTSPNAVTSIAADGSVTCASGAASASGTTNALAKFTATSTLGDSGITDDGSLISLTRPANQTIDVGASQAYAMQVMMRGGGVPHTTEAVAIVGFVTSMTYDVTSNAIGGQFLADATSNGAAVVTNIAVQGTARDGDVNYSWFSADGTMRQQESAQFATESGHGVLIGNGTLEADEVNIHLATTWNPSVAVSLGNTVSSFAMPGTTSANPSIRVGRSSASTPFQIAVQNTVSTGSETGIAVHVDTTPIATARGGLRLYRGAGGSTQAGGFEIAGGTNSIITGTAANDVIAYARTSGAKVCLGTGATPVCRVDVSDAGAVTINAPDSGTALTINGSVSSGDSSDDVFDHNGDLAKFGGSDGATYISGSAINAGYSTNAIGAVAVNYAGYQAGFTQFRNTEFYDGKAALACTITGSTKTLNCVGGLQVNGTDVATTSDLFTTANAIPKGDGSGLVASNITDSGSGVTINSAVIVNSAISVSSYAAAATIYADSNGHACMRTTNAEADCHINKVGYNNSTGQIRNLQVNDGTGSTLGTHSIAYFDGSDHSTTLYGVTTIKAGATTAIAAPTGTVLSLEQTDATDLNLTLRGTGNKYIAFGNTSNARDGYVWYSTSRNLLFGVINQTRMTIDASSGIKMGDQGGAVIGNNVDVLEIGNTGTAQTAGAALIDATHTGSFNTTSGAITYYGGDIAVSATESAGSNQLTAIALRLSATNSDDPIGLYVDAGRSIMDEGLAVTGQASTHALTVANSATGQTNGSTLAGVRAVMSGSFDATSAAQANAAVMAINTSTRSAGANDVTNFGIYANASGGQVNYAAYFEGDVLQTAGTLTATTFAVTGDATIGNANGDVATVWGRVITQGTAPSLSTCGTSPTVTGNGIAGTVTTGTGATACTISFPFSFGSAPSCVVTGRSGSVPPYSVSTTALTLTTANASAAYDYHCVGV